MRNQGNDLRQYLRLVLGLGASILLVAVIGQVRPTEAVAAAPTSLSAKVDDAVTAMDWTTLQEDPAAVERLRETMSAAIQDSPAAGPGAPGEAMNLLSAGAFLVNGALLKKFGPDVSDVKKWVQPGSDTWTPRLEVQPSPAGLDCPRSVSAATAGALAEAQAIRTRLDGVAKAIGRIAVDGHAKGQFLGTGFIMSGGWVVTARHVLTDAAVVEGSVEEGYGLSSDLVFEQTDDLGSPIRVGTFDRDHVILVPNADIAAVFLGDAPEVDQVVDLRRTEWLNDAMHAPPGVAWNVAILGYPYAFNVDDIYAVSASDSERAECLFGAIHGHPFLSMGPMLGVQLAGGLAFLHGASTIEGTSGAPIVDLRSGDVVGVHACSTVLGVDKCVSDGVPVSPAEGVETSGISNVGWSVNALCAYRPSLCS